MNSYDFSRLNDKEFEDLVIDLINAEIPNVNIERFMPGRDSGMDGRFYMGSNNIVIQSKHYVKSGYSSLIANLKKEVPKVVALNPSRYILAVCQGLTSTRKNEIISIFGSQYLRGDDILSIDDITHKISQNKNLERKYYKLWLNSTSILLSLLHNDVIGRSNHILEKIKESSDKYVETRDLAIAKNKIEHFNILIITGEPGVGKTTLAEQLCLGYILDGYELIYIESDIEEGEKIIEPDTKQLFLYDDFLGRNYLDALRNKEDSKIVRFINRIRGKNEKKLILTSRTTILNQGKASSELFYINNTDKHEYEVEVKNLDILDKAKVLYNHLWFSELSEKFKECIWKEKRYRAIISHKNYNPRLISFITDYDKVSHLEPERYWEYIVESLNNPAAIWEHMLTKQVPKCVYYLTYLVSLNNGKISEKDLHESYEEYLEIIGFDRSRNDYLDFKTCTLHAVKSTLQRKLEEGKDAIYDVLNPSISDYLIAKINDNLSSIPLFFSALSSLQSLGNLNILLNKKIAPSAANRIADELLSNINKNKSEDYIIEFIIITISSPDLSHNVKLKAARILNTNTLPLSKHLASYKYSIAKIVHWLAINDMEWLGYQYVLQYIKLTLLTNYDNLDYEDLNILGQISNVISEDELLDDIRNSLLEYWSDFVHEFISESNEFNDYYDLENKCLMKSKARDMVKDMLSESSIIFNECEIDDILDNIDLQLIVENNIQNSPDWDGSEYIERVGYRDSGFDAVDDIFSRE
ncbi:ATP-binding protein [Pectobacterium brasiliense]|uniref:nSTAND3 domain-containing NTPase n=1 Tax=Pectobacterium brasiliense TaxID=180957 RepID=UPI000C1BFBD3|nr:ATP-binding protein [Pectobacterium brasiliense]ATV45840.1 hypothetical protein CTV95_21560 [Pectobacterium brasiliense]MCA6981380.1 ATP-binding protein [Pectobacterium brasiliense]MCH4990942.1 ATP-binding protein [Pectobacterium brasiliense]